MENSSESTEIPQMGIYTADSVVSKDMEYYSSLTYTEVSRCWDWRGLSEAWYINK